MTRFFLHYQIGWESSTYGTSICYKEVSVVCRELQQFFSNLWWHFRSEKVPNGRCQITDITFHAARCFNIWRSVRFMYNTLVVSFMSCSRSLNMGLMNLTPRNIYRNADMEIVMLTHWRKPNKLNRNMVTARLPLPHLQSVLSHTVASYQNESFSS